MTLLENIVLSLIRGKISRYRSYQSHESLAIEALQSLDKQLVSRLHHKLSLLSGGQRQMVATLMAILSTPELLLLDEHTSALDPQTQQNLMNFTEKTIKEKKITTLMITHNLQHAVNYGDRLIMINHGKILLDIKGEAKAKFRAEYLLPYFDQSIKSEKNHAAILS
jgi:putative ABC transport system ATP-binding protein